MCVVPVLAAGFERLVGTNEEDEGKTVTLVLFADMRQAGVDTPAIDRVVYLRAVSSDIMLCSLGDLVIKTKVAPHVVVGFAKLVVCEKSAEGIIKCADSLLKRYGVVKEGVFVLV
jgi:hypothetical protein